jgi:hypothetical protein
MSIISNLLLILLISFFSFNSYGEKKDCSCPVVTCGPCQKKVTLGKSVKFCDWGDINVCRKEICENVNFYFNCLSQADKNKNDKDKKLTDASDIFLYEKDLPPKKGSKKNKRDLASKPQKRLSNEITSEGRKEVGNDSRVLLGIEYSNQVIGKIIQPNKKLQILHRGKVTTIAKNTELFVGDEISNLNGSSENIKIDFLKGSVSLKLDGKTKLLVEDPDSIMGRFQPFFYLIHGGVDLDVNLQEGSFDLLAGQILARSVGGKQRINYEMDPEGLKVKVESFKNAIEVLKANDLSGHQFKVEAGQFLSWVSETPQHLFNSDEKIALAGEGFITPIFEMTEKRKQELGLVSSPEKKLFADWNQLKSQNRSIASSTSSEGLCQAPQAKYQQCAWSCEGNSKGASGCQADKSNVQCVRRICNAAGQWGLPTAFASSYKDLCPAAGVRVGDCSP